MGGSDHDWAYSIQQTTDGGYIVAGGSTSYDGDVTDNHWGWGYWVVKLNSSGNIQWEKSLGGSGGESAYSIQQTTDGGYIVAGSSDSNDGDVTSNHGSSDYWVVKLDSSGNIQWQKSLGGSDNDFAHFIQQTTDSGYIVAGNSMSNDGDVTGNHGDFDYWIVKLDSTGNIMWQKPYGGSGDDYAYSIQQTTDGGYIIAGYSESNDGDVTGNHGNYDYWIVKLAPDNLGTEEISIKENLTIYPNPVKDILTIEGIAPNTQLIITDLTGKTILSTTVKSNKESIDVSGLPAGVYFINKTKFIKR